MKGVSKLIPVILTLFMLIFNISLVSASTTSFDFKIVVSYDFDDNEDIECSLEIDDNDEKTIEFNDDDTKYTNDLKKTLKLDCKKDLDKIKLYIYDEDGEELERKTYEDDDKFEYNLNVVDKTEKWFEIEIDNDFDSTNIDCDLEVDGDKFEYEFDEDSKSDDLEIKKNFENTIEFDCEEDMDRIRFKVYDDDEEELEDKTYEDKDSFDYDIDENKEENEMKIVLDHDFDDNDDIKCTLELDDNDKETFTFDKDSDSDELEIVKHFKEEIKFDCSDDIDEIELRIYDDNGDKVDSETWDNDDEFEYKYNAGNYEFFIQVDEITSSKEIDCRLYIDGEKEDKYELDEDSSLKDKRIEGDFKEEFELVCENGKLDEVTLMIFEVQEDENKKEKKLFDKKYKGVEKVGYNAKETYEVEEETPQKVQEVNVVKEVEPQEDKTQNDSIKVDGNYAQNTSNEQNNINSQTGNNVEVLDQASSTKEEIKNETTNNSLVETQEDSGISFTSILLGILLLVILGIIIIVLFIDKDFLKFDKNKSNKKKKHSSKKKDLNFDFLNKKKN